MKYSTEVVIGLPRERVIELFDDPDNMMKWQKGLQSFEHISGELGQPGAKSHMVFDLNGRIVEMVETITVRNLPDEFSGTYDAKGDHNIIVNRFYEEGADKTRWVTENEFKFKGIMALMSLFMGRAFKKQTTAFMNDFKTFMENAS